MKIWQFVWQPWTFLVTSFLFGYLWWFDVDIGGSYSATTGGTAADWVTGAITAAAVVVGVIAFRKDRRDVVELAHARARSTDVRAVWVPYSEGLGVKIELINHSAQPIRLHSIVAQFKEGTTRVPTGPRGMDFNTGGRPVVADGDLDRVDYGMSVYPHDGQATFAIVRDLAGPATKDDVHCEVTWTDVDGRRWFSYDGSPAEASPRLVTNPGSS